MKIDYFFISYNTKYINLNHLLLYKTKLFEIKLANLSAYLTGGMQEISFDNSVDFKPYSKYFLVLNTINNKIHLKRVRISIMPIK